MKIKEIKGHVLEKGHLRELEILDDVLQGKTSQWPIELWDMFQTTEVTFEIEKGDRLCVA